MNLGILKLSKKKENTKTSQRTKSKIVQRVWLGKADWLWKDKDSHS